MRWGGLVKRHLLWLLGAPGTLILLTIISNMLLVVVHLLPIVVIALLILLVLVLGTLLGACGLASLVLWPVGLGPLSLSSLLVAHPLHY